MIKWLIATNETQGQRPNDFNFCNEREVLFHGDTCHNGENPDDTCGCGRAFSGLETRKGTTTMQVVALPWDPCDLIKATLKSYEQGGFTVDKSMGEAIEMEILRLLDIVDDEFHYGDIVEYRGTKGLQLRRAYHPTHTYQCPACLSHEHIDICADIWVRLVQSSPDNFETDIDEAHNHDHEWDGNHGAVCQNCNFGHNVYRFETENWRPAEEADEPGPCTTCGTQCEGDGTGAVICPKCIQTKEGKERL